MFDCGFRLISFAGRFGKREMIVDRLSATVAGLLEESVKGQKGLRK